MLRDELEELAGLLPEELEVDSEDLGIALKYLQSLEPAGVGARDIGECLALPRIVECLLEADVEACDINPLLVTADGALAADALISVPTD